MENLEDNVPLTRDAFGTTEIKKSWSKTARIEYTDFENQVIAKASKFSNDRVCASFGITEEYLKEILEKHFLNFIQDNNLDNLKEQMIETITRAEYEVHDYLDEEIEDEAHDICHDYQIQIKDLKAELYDMMKKEKDDLEFYSIIRAIKAMDEADVCLLVIDATKGVTAQDLTIFSLASKKGKGIVVLINKWDLIDKQNNTARDYEKVVKEKLAPFSDVPVLFISAIEKIRIFKAIELALEVYENKHRKIPTSQLNDIMQKAILKYQAPVVRGHIVKIKFVSQLPTKVPSFAFFTNFPDDIKTPYQIGRAHV